jgi:tetratricopeptide (TPR) repeat protein
VQVIDQLLRRRLSLIAALTAALWGPPAFGEERAALQPLVEQARHWESKSRPDLAAETWKKVLLLDPNNGDALAGLAVNAARQGRSEEANAYAARLKAINPKHPGLSRIQDALDGTIIDKRALREARELARQGKAAEAVSQYKKVLGSKGSPSLRLEYYETLAGLDHGWQEARQGLAQLVRDYPEESRFALALARVLTYRPAARAAGR